MFPNIRWLPPVPQQWRRSNRKKGYSRYAHRIYGNYNPTIIPGLGARQNRIGRRACRLLGKRLKMSVSGASPSPGFHSIYGMLETTSSQTAPFSWSQYLDDVGNRLYEVFNLGGAQLYSRNDINHLSRSTLLDCMDFLYIIQRTPGERTMTVSEPRGIATLIVWAHYILGITVIVTIQVARTK